MHLHNTLCQASHQLIMDPTILSIVRPSQDVNWSFDKKLSIAKNFGPCQPAWTAQADVGRYLLQMY